MMRIMTRTLPGILMACIISTAALFAQSGAHTPDYRISSIEGTEPFIAVNPSDPRNVIAAWMQVAVEKISIAVSYSTDGGQTWSKFATMPHVSPSFTGADVSLAFDGKGVAWICYIDYKLAGDSGYVMTAHSTDKGQNWSVPVRAISGAESSDLPIDRPWIEIDRSGGQYDGRIYLTSKSYYMTPLPHHVWFKRSLDGGATWSTLKMIDDSIPSDLVQQSMGALTVGADGSVYVGYASLHLALSLYARMICSKSTDGGGSFTPQVAEQLTAKSGIVDSLYQPSYRLSANPADARNLVLITTDARYGDPDILSLRSTDGGASWSQPVRVNDDAVNNGVMQDMCWGVFSPAGACYAAWRDRRNSGGRDTDAFEVYTAVSTDGGATYSKNFDLSDTLSPFINIARGNDFLGVSADSNVVHSAWCDKRTGIVEIFSGKASLASIVSSVKGTSGDGLSAELIPSRIFPDPFSSDLHLHVEDNRAATLHIALSNVAGRIVFSESVEHSTGVQDIPLNVGAIPAGVYMLKVATSRGSSVQLVVRTGTQ